MGNALLLASPTQVLDAERLIAAFENSPEGLAIADHGALCTPPQHLQSGLPTRIAPR